MNTFNFSSVPFVRLLIPLFLGRLLSVFLQFDILIAHIIIALTFLGVLYIILNPKLRYVNRWVNGLAISLVVFGFGIANKPYVFDDDLFGKPLVYKARVKDIVKESSQKQNIILTCVPVGKDTNYYFSAIAYVKQDSSSCQYLPNDEIIFKSDLKGFQVTGNPYVFEYGIYLKNKGLKGQFFLKGQQIEKLGATWNLKRFFYSTRKKAELKLRQLEIDEAEFGIISALLLGNKSMLDYETKSNFSSAGAIHVLSVSGLHVGIIYLLLMALVGRIGRGNVATFKVLLVLTALWAYAAITGMSPSVFRATIMFSVFLVGKRIQHQYNIYHSLAIAAFIILVFNPYAVFHAGFWLSFLAVASIVYFYPQINKLVYFKTPWGKYIWALVSVSFAVQIGTAPLSIYLFGFFPSWFVLSNVMVVPALPFILIGAITVVIFPEGSFGSMLVADSVSVMLVYLNDVTKWIANLPFARFTGLQLQFYQILLLYVSLLMFIVWQHAKHGLYLVRALLFFLVSLVCVSWVSFDRYQQELFTVHQIRGKSLFSYASEKKCQYWSNQEIDKKEVSNVLAPLLLTREISALTCRSLDSIFYLPLQTKGKNVLVLNDTLTAKLLDEADILIFTSKLNYSQIKHVFDKVRHQQLVFDSSFSAYKIKGIKNEVLKHGLNAYFVTEAGAFVLGK